MVALRVLGPVAVEVDGRIEPLASAKQRLVLAVLAAAHGAPVPRARLEDALWGDRPPPSAAGTLMGYVSRLRAAFGPAVIESHPEGYRLGDVHLDADDLVDALEPAADVVALEHALGCWRGDAFGELVEHPFLVAEARRLHELRTEVRVRLAARYLDLGDTARPTSMLEAVVDAEPRREDAWALLVRALLEAGRAADAVGAASRARRRLAEIGLDPSPSLVELETAALQQRAEAPASPVRYARNGAVHLAFQVIGDGSVDLVLSSYGSVSIDSIWDSPPFASFVEALAAVARVVLYDTRGVGLSDPIDTEAAPSVEEQAADLAAVLDAANVRRPVLVGVGDGGPVAITHAATGSSTGVAGLVLVNTFARLVAADDYPDGVPRDRFDANLTMSTDPASARDTSAVLRNHAPSVADDAAFRRWWDRAGRRGASPATATALWRVRYGADVRPLLGRLTMPTLVLHRRRTRVVPFVHGRHLADGIPGARFVELDGADQPPFTEGVDEIVSAVAALVTEVAGGGTGATA